MNWLLKAACLILAICCLTVGFAACKEEEKIDDKAYYDYINSKTGYGKDIFTKFVEREIDSKKVEDFVPSDKESDYVLIKVKDYGEIVAVLRQDVAPVSVANFKKLVKSGFYDGTIFHRIIKDFMIQGGGLIVEENADGSGTTVVQKEAETIFGEFSSNGFENHLYHSRGVLSMARSDAKDSASSQFFIVHEDSEFLDGNYAAFGHVTEGLEVLDAVASVATYPNDMPCKKVVIKKMSIVK